MMTLSSTIRSVVCSVLCVAAIAWGQEQMSAASCESWSGSWDFISLTYCGAYGDENDALPDMRSKAAYYAQAYFYQGGVHSDPYWWGRVTPFEQPAYYDSGWAVCAPSNCY